MESYFNLNWCNIWFESEYVLKTTGYIIFQKRQVKAAVTRQNELQAVLENKRTMTAELNAELHTLRGWTKLQFFNSLCF